MLRQIKLLTAVQLRNMFGINEVLHTKDKKKKNRFFGMAVIWLLLIAMAVFYMVMLSRAFASLGMAGIIPLYMFLVIALVILFFSFFKASAVIFQMSTFELMISLPVSGAAIVVSRFLTMYAANLALSMVVMLPGMVVYGIYVHPGAGCYFYFLLGTVLLPLLPMSLATVIGMLITAVSSGMKHKSMISALITVFLMAAVIVGSTAFSSNAQEMSEEMIRNIVGDLTAQVSKVYPPAVWFTDAAVNGNWGAFLILLAVSAGVFVCMAAIIQKFFRKICTALNATSARNDFEMKSLSVESPLRALWKRELKRYFASSIYVSNTMMGYVIMALLPAALMIIGPAKVEGLLQLPGIVGKALPMVLAVTAVIMPITSCSVSLEGRQWWIVQSLPVRSKDVFAAKILLNLTIAAPFYLVAVVCSWLAVRPSLTELLCIALVPAGYLMFTSVMGLSVNLAMPVMEWENEVRVVKQSASGMISMLCGLLSCIPPVVCLFLLKDVPQAFIFAGTIVALLIVTAVLYRKNSRVQLIEIGAK